MKKFIKELLHNKKQLILILAGVLVLAFLIGSAMYLGYTKKHAANRLPKDTLADVSEDVPASAPSFDDIQKKYKKIKTVTMCSSTRSIIHMKGKIASDNTVEQTFYFKAPSKMLLKGPDQVLYCDGKTVVAYIPNAKQYTSTDFSELYYQTLAEGSPGVNTIGLLSNYDYSNRLVQSEYIGEEKVKDWECYLFKLHLKPDTQKDDLIEQKVWIDKATGIMVRNYYKYPVKDDPEQTVIEADSTATALTVDNNIEDSVFVFVPHNDDKLFDAAAESKKMAEELKKLEIAQKEADAKNPINKKVSDFALRYYTIEDVYSDSKDSLTKDAAAEGVPKDNNETALQSENAAADAPKTDEEKSEDAAVNADTPKTAPVEAAKKNVAHATTFYSVTAAKNTVAAFWAYPDTAKFLPLFDKIYKANKDKYNFISICLNIAAEEEKAFEDFGREGHEFPIYFMKPDEINTVIDKWVIQGIPMIYFIDSKSVMKQFLFGEGSITEEKIQSAVKQSF